MGRALGPRGSLSGGRMPPCPLSSHRDSVAGRPSCIIGKPVRACLPPACTTAPSPELRARQPVQRVPRCAQRSETLARSSRTSVSRESSEPSNASENITGAEPFNYILKLADPRIPFPTQHPYSSLDLYLFGPFNSRVQGAWLSSSNSFRRKDPVGGP